MTNEAEMRTETVDPTTKLAVDRTRLAYERNLMAWVRTAVSLITFGFTIYNSSNSRGANSDTTIG